MSAQGQGSTNDAKRVVVSAEHIIPMNSEEDGHTAYNTTMDIYPSCFFVLNVSKHGSLIKRCSEELRIILKNFKKKK